MGGSRGEFSSRFGFLMAATGSAVGLGNIWGFPTNAASNGGGAFLFTYLILVFVLAYPALMAELIIGRHARANAVIALQGIATTPVVRTAGAGIGFAGIITVTLILSFYAIVSGWMVAFLLDPLLRMLGQPGAARWLTTDGIPRNVVFTLVFMALTVYVVSAGVKDGIEKWASRLMPSLVVILFLLILYVLTLPGALDGLRAYLIPDVNRIADTGLLINAMGQAFFSLSLGVGTMLVYGSYVSKRENLPALGTWVALLDSGIAFLAGLLILPAMYAAQANGVQIYDANGGLIAGPGLILSVLPALFDTMGGLGLLIATAFFALMVIASLTSSISMLEVPVAYAVEALGYRRERIALGLGGLISLICLVIIWNFGRLFDAVVSLTTEYSQPLLGLCFCVFAGWIWRRDALLAELKEGCPGVADTLFWKVWPFYVRFICPLAILAVYYQLLAG